ncbi:MAG: PspA/IM30 family protein, partial [Kangiellaceae bacterium]|nr:PspA/IM30 family protein [Kangiellaceae bacterium]
DSKEYLVEAKHGLTEIVAKKMAAERNLNTLKYQIEENEGYAIKALEKNDEPLALEVAEKIAKLESKAENFANDLASYEKNVEILKTQIQEAEKIIAEHERELAMVKTRESVQNATKSVTQTISTNESAIGSARESLQRIKEKQQGEQDKLDAGIQLRKDMQGDDLEHKLTSSGIKNEKHSAASVLERLKKK